MARSQILSSPLLLPCLLLALCVFIKPSTAFGAGNIASISKIEGQNWRHGDIEDTLLQLLMTRLTNKKFSKLDVKRVYFGNWLRDYSQAVDVGTVKYVSAEAIRVLLWILGFMSFGFGTGEFEVTTERLGCYRPEEHIDNPKDYADNIDARQYDRRLRGPVDERRELAVDERNGLKNYIASEDMGIVTSAGHVRKLLRQCIDLARRSKRNNDNAAFFEALRLLGTATHCMEDYTAHSNYTELCLIEMGERDVFPHVGRRTQVRLRGARNEVYPIVTGTFGGTDFLHSVCGELSDKSTQSEVQELEGVIDGSQNQNNVSMIKNLLNQLPSGLFGGEDEAGKIDQLQANAAAGQMQNMRITPKEPEAFTRQVLEIQKQIYPVIEFHDQVMKGITETVDKIPVLPDLIEKLQEQMSILVFSLIAPFILPVIRQLKSELATGSSEIIASSEAQQHIVFNNDNSSDPTHSMLSKDHFSNILNEPAGKTASAILKWTVPQVVECWDDERADVDRTLNRIINGVFHHPALREQGDDGARDGRQMMYRVVETWWREQSPREQNDLRDKLSREGVRAGRNHKEGVHDTGHGCGHPLKVPGKQGSSSANPLGNILGAAAGGAMSGLQGGNQSMGSGRQQNQMTAGLGQAASEAVGGGLLGGLVSGVVGGLGSAFEGQNVQSNTYQQQSYGRDGSYTQSTMQTAHQPGGYGGGQQERYGQAEYKRTELASGGQREEYKRYEQEGSSGRQGYGFEQRVETKPTYGGGYERTEERKYERPGGQVEVERRTEGVDRRGETYSHESKQYGSRNDDSDEEKKERKRREKAEKERRKQQKGYGSNDNDSDDDKPKYGRRKSNDSDDGKKYKRQSGGGYGKRDDSDDEKRNKRHSGRNEYGQQQSQYGGGGRRDDSNERRSEKRNSGRYGQQEQSSYGGERQEYGSSSGGGYGGGRREDESSYGRQQESSYGGRQEQSYGGRQQESSYGGREEQSSYGRQEQSSYGGGRSEYSQQGRNEYGGNQQGRNEYGGGRDEMPGGFGGDNEQEEYGGNRQRRSQYGEENQGGGYGQEGYGDRY